MLTCNVLSGIEVDGKFVSVEKVSAKTVCQMLVKHKFSKPTSEKSSTSVIRTFGAQCLYLSARASIESKIRMFQILNNVLYLDQRLSNMNIVGSSLCSHCKKEPKLFHICF